MPAVSRASEAYGNALLLFPPDVSETRKSLAAKIIDVILTIRTIRTLEAHFGGISSILIRAPKEGTRNRDLRVWKPYQASWPAIRVTCL